MEYSAPLITGRDESFRRSSASAQRPHPELEDLAVEMQARGLSARDIAAFKDENKIV
jgi:hypothetical protein